MQYLHQLRQDCPLPIGAPVLIYVRDSGHEAQDRSVSQQLAALTEYITAHSLTLLDVYNDEAKLSTNTDRRDALNALRDHVHTLRKPINDKYKREKATAAQPLGIVVYSSSRLGRDQLEVEAIRLDFALRGVTVIDVTERATGIPLADRILHLIKAQHDEMVLEDISRASKRGLAQLVGLRDTDPEFQRHNPGWTVTGGYVGIHPGTPPRGFRHEAVTIGTNARTGKLRSINRLVPDVGNEWERALLAWEMRTRGSGLKAIHAATGLYKTPANYSTFFENEIYVGTLSYGGATYENFVPALIPRAWYDEEQQRKAARAQKLAGKSIGEHEPARVGAGYLLSGLIFCTCTGERHAMHGNSVGSPPRAWRHYVCSRAHRRAAERCTAKPISARAVEEAVIGVLMERALTPEVLRAIAADLSRTLNAADADDQARLSALRSRRADVQRAIDNLMDAIEQRGMSDALQSRLVQREADARALDHDLRTLESAVALRAAAPALTDADILARGELAREGLRAGGADAQAVVRAFVDCVLVDANSVEIVLSFPDSASEKLGQQSMLHTRRLPYPSSIRLARGGHRLRVVG